LFSPAKCKSFRWAVKDESEYMENLYSDRIKLRLIENDDKNYIYSYRSDPAIYRYQAWKPTSVEDVGKFITNSIVREPNIPDSWLQLAICEKSTNEFIGDCGIHFLKNNEPNQVEIGITIKRICHEKGYATETLTLIFDYIFLTLKKHRIIASVDPGNQASIKLMEKMKMRKEAHFIKNKIIDGKWVDDVIYAILEDEWQKK
jgi:RimJ/RimL family protein N-acetyltransferase